MNKLSLYIFIQFAFLLSISSAYATMWANISTKELIKKSDVILIGTVSEATNYYSSMPKNVEPDLKYIREEGRFQTIKLKSVLYTNQQDLFSQKTTNYIYTLDTSRLRLDISPYLRKDTTYLMFLVIDTTDNRAFIIDKGLPKGVYVWPAYSASMSLISEQDRKYKSTLAEIEEVIGPLPKDSKTIGNN